jgi:hypothetical protein
MAGAASELGWVEIRVQVAEHFEAVGLAAKRGGKSRKLLSKLLPGAG